MHKTLREEVQGICFDDGGYPEKWLKHEKCPCCYSHNISYLFSKFKISHWYCKDCSFVFVNPYPDQNILDRIYNTSYYPALRKYIEAPKARKGRDDASESLEVGNYTEIINYITQRRQTGSWLDVGGGIGTFLNMVKRDYPNFSVYLNESNQESISLADELYGIKALPDSAQRLYEKGNRFDVITLISVLEHVSYPQEFVNDYTNLLNPGGIIFINVPQFTTLNRLFSRQESYNVIPPYHLSFFNKQNIEHILPDTFANIHAWDCGGSAFLFSHFARLSEHYDIVIPETECEKQTVISCKSFTFAERLLVKALSLADKCFGNIITKIDGGTFLNIAAVKD